ncbi:immune inhibitor A, partial [Intrasporangium calvum]
MKKLATASLVGSAVAALIATAGAPAGAATPSVAGAALGVTPTAAAATTGGERIPAARPDNRPGPLTKTWITQRQEAISLVAQGKAKASSDGVVELADDKFAEVSTVKTDKILTMLAEFGDLSVGRYGTTPGPLHNEIAEPDRTVNNSNYWQSDFSKAYYENFFNGAGESMKSYYEALSNGQYSVVNTVEDWVKVPYNASYYGDNAVEDNGGSWRFIEDTGNAWWDAQIAAGKTPAEIDAYLSEFDVWDRYDHDNDGEFDEADGYIDHFQAVHAGMGEDAGGGAQGADAIWSHRWYVNGNDFGVTGPTLADGANLMGGARIGESKYWLGDYTTEPENGGLGVFAHEFGHDLGLPDYYDTGGGENSTAFWTLMSSGSWLGHGAVDGNGIGTLPGLMGPEEKLFLGWLDHSTVDLGSKGTFTLNPAQLQVDGKDQAVRVNLPAKDATVHYTTPNGGHAWWTGSADGLNDTLTRAVPAASRVTITAKAWYDIEAGYDYLYGEYSLDGGATWKRTGRPIDGSSSGRWAGLRYSYTANGAPSLFRFRYQTDGGVHLPGAFVDDITIKAGTTVVDDVESGVGDWTATGEWQISTGTVGGTFEQYYLVENREYVGYDVGLAHGPYQFSKGLTAPDWVEFFTFQNGMLVWYVDDSYEDNNVSAHAGGGAAMVVDARPTPFTYPDGTRPSNRRQPFDATFGLESTEATCLHKEVSVGHGPSATVESLA